MREGQSRQYTGVIQPMGDISKHQLRINLACIGLIGFILFHLKLQAYFS